MTPRIMVGMLGIAMLLAAPCASAVDEYGRWYGTLMLSGIDEDGDRGLETEWSGYHLGVGRGFGPDWAVELNFVGTRFKNRAGDEALVQWGFGLDATRRLAETRYFTPYFVVGAGWLMSDYKLNRVDRDGPMASAGFGVLTPLSKSGVALRTELRYRRDMSDEGMSDYLLSIGINVPFSWVNLGPPANRAASGGTVLPDADERPFGWQRDVDSDGVADVADACPSTPPGEVVDARGCARAEDQDGDGVPNEDDICPDTPAAAAIDQYGCMLTDPRHDGGER